MVGAPVGNVFHVDVSHGGAQTDQDFDWILLVDPELPTVHRRQSSAFVETRPRPYLRDYSPAMKVWRHDWVRNWLNSYSGPLATTRLDDDDALTPMPIEMLRQLFSIRDWRSGNAISL